MTKDPEPVKPLLAALKMQRQKRPPFWMMRQAGRYLPEYRDVRAKAGGFLDLVFNPDLAAEVTVQPIRRFGMDAAILFSDILVTPLALGQSVTFAEGEGPVLSPVRDAAAVAALNFAAFDKTLAPVYETVSKTRQMLKNEGFTETALIGFAGAPWTVACYMVEGGGSRDFIHVKSWAYRDPSGFAKLIDLLTDATIRYLSAQIEAGAEAVKLFDSHAGVLDEAQFRRWVIEPAKKIAQSLRRIYPDIPLIGFPRGAGRLYQDYTQSVECAGIAIDPQVPVKWAAAALQPRAAVQGNLDPVCLLTGGDAMTMALEEILGNLSAGPFIFNLGHGIIKDTPVANMEKLSEAVKSWRF